MSALLIARGFAGPSGRVAIIDTESGRGSLYADVIPGGYQTLELSEPFSPQRYIDAIKVAEDAGFDCLVIDSMSHSWEGIGGVLDMAGEIEKRSGKSGLHCWKDPKLQHQKMVLKLLQTKLKCIICCLRAKHKSRQGKDDRGKTVIIKDDHVTPIQSEDFIFEMTVHAEIYPNHTIRITKPGHPDLMKCFPEDGKGMLTLAHGKAIAQWATAGGEPAAAPDELAVMKGALWGLNKKHLKKNKSDFETWLKESRIMQPSESLEGLDLNRASVIVDAVTATLEGSTDEQTS